MNALPTTTELIAAASELLQGGGYQAVREGFPEWNTSSSRLFEDAYNVVGLAVFQTCAELFESWPNLQGSLVDVISRRVGAGEKKAWDGYLVLLTAGVSADNLKIEEIRYNTTRLRKLVGTAEDLSSAGDVERLLRPLLPLQTERSTFASRSALDLLPGILAQHEIPERTTTALVRAFLEHESLMDGLHSSGATT